MTDQAEKAERFRRLHGREKILVLPNCWDVASARLFEDAGFPAVATSSAGMLVSLGYPDGEKIPREEFVAVVKRIAGALQAPLSVDLVGGFGKTPADVAETAKMVVGAGAVGLNIEDFEHEAKKLVPIEEQEARLNAVLALRDSLGIPFVLNARTDALRFAPGSDEEKMKEAIRRGRAYRDLGADCVYPMGLTEPGSIGTFVRALDFPVNVMVRKGLPSVSELQELGVARLSFGPSASYAAMGLLRRAAKEVLERGTFDLLLAGAMNFDELNELAQPKKGTR